MSVLSVIIPTLNEADSLEATLLALACNQTPHEVLVVDGGSSDGTPELARKHGARVFTSAYRQRGQQMNEGRTQAHGEILLFLHADTLVAPTALQSLTLALRSPSVVGGGFARRYSSSSRFLWMTCRLAELRSRWLGWFLGDQAIFVTTPVFDALGGFQKMDTFEDLDFSRQMKKAGRVVTLRPPVISSPRRFTNEGPIRTTLADLWLTCRYLGISGSTKKRM